MAQATSQTKATKTDDGKKGSSTSVKRKERILEPPQAATEAATTPVSANTNLYRQEDPSDSDKKPIHRHEALQHAYGNQFLARRQQSQRGIYPSGIGADNMASDSVETDINRKRGSGRPLPKDTQTDMESSMGADFSGVRIHNDSESHTLSRSLNARAFTTGQDVFFGENEYNPSSGEGRHLLAHELTHVVQQGGSDPKDSSANNAPQAKLEVSQPGDPLEKEADEVADQVTKEGPQAATPEPPPTDTEDTTNPKDVMNGGLDKITPSRAPTPVNRSPQKKRRRPPRPIQRSTDAANRIMPVFGRLTPAIQRFDSSFKPPGSTPVQRAPLARDSWDSQPAARDTFIHRAEDEGGAEVASLEEQEEQFFYQDIENNNIPEEHLPSIEEMLAGVPELPQEFDVGGYDIEELNDLLNNDTAKFAKQIATADATNKGDAGASKSLQDYMKTVAVFDIILKIMETVASVPVVLFTLAVVIGAIMYGIGQVLMALPFGVGIAPGTFLIQQGVYAMTWGATQFGVWGGVLTNIGFVIAGFRNLIILMRMIGVMVMLSEGVHPDAIRGQTKALVEQAATAFVEAVFIVGPNVAGKGKYADTFKQTDEAANLKGLTGKWGGAAAKTGDKVGLGLGLAKNTTGAIPNTIIAVDEAKEGKEGEDGAKKWFASMGADIGLGTIMEGDQTLDPYKETEKWDDPKKGEEYETVAENEEGTAAENEEGTDDTPSQLDEIKGLVLDTEIESTGALKAFIDTILDDKDKGDKKGEEKEAEAPGVLENLTSAEAKMDEQIKAGAKNIETYDKILDHLIATGVIMTAVTAVVAAGIASSMGSTASLPAGIALGAGVVVALGLIWGFIGASIAKANQRKAEAQEKKKESEDLKAKVTAKKAEVTKARDSLVEARDDNQGQMSELQEASEALEERLNGLTTLRAELPPPTETTEIEGAE